MATELEVITKPEDLTEKVLEIPTTEHPQTLLAELGGGVLRFTEAVFPNVDVDKILVQSNIREPEGRGPHFDVYSGFIDKSFPWLGIFNLSGLATLTVMDLPDDLAASYFARWPKPTDEAFDARRLFSVLALEAPGAEPTTGKVKEGTGFVLPQKPKGPHIVHDIVPEDSKNAGRFVKFIVPNRSNETRKRMKEGGYEPLDELLTRGIGSTAVKDSGTTVITSSPGAPEARQPRRRLSVSPSILDAFRPRYSSSPTGRRCNLD
ncbi:MAG TPA: hypothetical protein VMR76_01615 [Candidatus Saccharimonadia bacterium]|nr:hypothetical protein [Candidatus Saccharimonadia bacterium]